MALSICASYFLNPLIAFITNQLGSTFVIAIWQGVLNASANKARKPQNRLRIKGDGLKQRTQIVAVFILETDSSSGGTYQYHA